MVPASSGDERVQFGTFEVDMKSGELRRNGNRIRLQEQPFQILSMLLEHPGEVVSREEMRGRLWPADTYVDFDHSLNAAVRRLRDALGDTAENPRFVETVARRGYRLLVPVIVPANGGGIPTEPAMLKPDDNPAPKPSLRIWWILVVVGAVILASAGLLLGWWLGRRSTPEPSAAIRQLTANPSSAPVISAALSPDGKILAYADPTGLYLRQIATGETNPLSTPDKVKLLPKSWFPDGSHFVAVGTTGPKDAPSIWNTSILGGSARKLAEDGADPVVSPDGSQIVFVRGTPAAADLWIMQSDGSQPHRVATSDGSLIATPIWAPDGSHIAFISGRYHPGTYSMDTRIENLNVATGARDTILVRAGLKEGLAWTRTGRLIFAAEEQPNPDDSNLWYVNLDLGSAKPLGAPIRITRETGIVHHVSVSADGQRLVFFRSKYQPDVYVSEVDPHGLKVSTPQLLTLDEREDFPYTWTPDSRSVIFVSNRDGQQHIYRQAVDQSSAELLVGGVPGRLQTPRLSPDKKSLLYLAMPKTGEASNLVRMMRVPVEGGPSQFVLEGDGINNHQCAFLPVTLCIFSVTSANQIRFYTFDSATGKSQELPTWKREHADYYKFNWSLSPDGRTVALATGTRDEPEITLKSTVDGTERSLPLQSWAGISSFDWASDSQSLWVAAYTFPNTSFLLNVDLQGHAKTVLEDKEMKIGWAIPSPDRRRLALWKGSGESNVWMVDRF